MALRAQHGGACCNALPIQADSSTDIHDARLFFIDNASVTSHQNRGLAGAINPYAHAHSPCPCHPCKTANKVSVPVHAHPFEASHACPNLLLPTLSLRSCSTGTPASFSAGSSSATPTTAP